MSNRSFEVAGQIVDVVNKRIFPGVIHVGPGSDR